MFGQRFRLLLRNIEIKQKCALQGQHLAPKQKKMKETFPLRTRFQWINAFAVKISLVILLTVCRTNLMMLV